MKIRSVVFDQPRPHPTRANLPVRYLSTEGKGPNVVPSIELDGLIVWVGDLGYPLSWCRLERFPVSDKSRKAG
jgi:hypothetical protein